MWEGLLHKITHTHTWAEFAISIHLTVQTHKTQYCTSNNFLKLYSNVSFDSVCKPNPWFSCDFRWNLEWNNCLSRKYVEVYWNYKSVLTLFVILAHSDKNPNEAQMYFSYIKISYLPISLSFIYECNENTTYEIV